METRVAMTGVLARAVIAMVTGLVGVVGVVGGGFGMQGCAYTVPPPEVVEVPYAGPNVEIEQAGSFHVLKFTAPTAGWNMRVDRVVEGYGFQGVYATVARPNPAFSYAQQMVDQWVATSVRMSEPVKVFVRTVDFKGESATGEAYSYVRESAGVIRPAEERRRAPEPVPSSTAPSTAPADPAPAPQPTPPATPPASSPPPEK